ncbi:MAG: hypothetical protein KGS72_05630 [Cyanobacteria bacterium REEB67]|nr:hypothetical protein [Cyanobacteria bacterium REEB67]
MAQIVQRPDKKVDQANLKSFQRISEEDMRYLRELDRSRRANTTRENDELQESIPITLHQRLRAALITARKIMRRTLNKILYERVPGDESYSEGI